MSFHFLLLVERAWIVVHLVNVAEIWVARVNHRTSTRVMLVNLLLWDSDALVAVLDLI